MYLKRKIDEYLLEWKKNEERLPLIIKGARQIGKTESINHFAEQNYSNIVSINFVLETSLDKGTQRKTTENELPSLTQCTA